MNPKVNPDFTFSIAKIINFLCTAQLHADVMTKETARKEKKVFGMVVTRCELAKRDVIELLKPEAREIVKNELMNSETFLLIDNITTVILALPVEMRNEIEDYVIERYNEYAGSKAVLSGAVKAA